MKTLLRFSIRDLLWAAIVVGLALGWWLDHRAYAKATAEATRVAQGCQLLIGKMQQAGVWFQDNSGSFTLYPLPEHVTKHQDEAKLAKQKLQMVEARLAQDGRFLKWSAYDSVVEITPRAPESP
jgi:hypothetical protein